MPKRASEEGGWILVTAISLMAVMLVVALASMAIVDTQQNRTREQRERESSLNVAEGALFAQGFQLARAWPGTQATAGLQDCSSAAPAATCPTALQVQQNADNVDTRADTTWTTLIRDNGGNLSTEYQPAFVNAAQIGTNAAGAAIHLPGALPLGRQRGPAAVGPVERRRPGKAAIHRRDAPARADRRIHAAGGGDRRWRQHRQQRQPGQDLCRRLHCGRALRPGDDRLRVATRAESSPRPCRATAGNMMTPSQIERMKATAIARGTYYDGCANLPTIGGDLNLAGQVVFIDMPWSHDGEAGHESLHPAACRPSPPAAATGCRSPASTHRSRPGSHLALRQPRAVGQRQRHLHRDHVLRELLRQPDDRRLRGVDADRWRRAELRRQQERSQPRLRELGRLRGLGRAGHRRQRVPASSARTASRSVR